VEYQINQRQLKIWTNFLFLSDMSQQNANELLQLLQSLGINSTASLLEVGATQDAQTYNRSLCRIMQKTSHASVIRLT
jgi:hypothetical protein